MPDSSAVERRNCRWVSRDEALKQFASYAESTTSQAHIKPLHWYAASRLVLEGGFDPADITPRPPFQVERRGSKLLLRHDPTLGGGGEATVLGGLKTKNVDVVVAKPGLGPVLAISCKGITGAFRNLTNRMEETIGECTNLHITYPALVFGYLFAVRANRQVESAVALAGTETTSAARQLSANDIAIGQGGEPVESIIRFSSALRDLSGRRGIRNDVSRYEAVSLMMVDMSPESMGQVVLSFPSAESRLRVEDFFSTLYLRYDERYVYSAPDLKRVTARKEWDPESPVLGDPMMHSIDYSARIS